MFPLEVSHSDNHPLKDGKNNIKCGGYLNFSEADSRRTEDPDGLGVKSPQELMMIKQRVPSVNICVQIQRLGHPSLIIFPHWGICK